MRTAFQEGDDTTWLLGDSAYPTQPWLLTPILDAAPGSPQEKYTKRHTSARSCIEKCLRVLKGRFRCLHGERGLRYAPETVEKIVVVCAVLHNMCISFNVPYLEDEIELEDIGDLEAPPNVKLDMLKEGRRVRDKVITRYFTK